jgi:hypothetical protein
MLAAVMSESTVISRGTGKPSKMYSTSVVNTPGPLTGWL